VIAFDEQVENIEKSTA